MAKLLPSPSCVVKVGDGRGFIIEHRQKLPRRKSTYRKGSLKPVDFVKHRLVITAAHCLPKLPAAQARSFISDMAQTLGELKDAGYGIGGKLKDKIRGIAKAGQMEFAGNHLIRKCSLAELGEAIHQFADVAKTIGDAYLTYGARKMPDEEDELIARVRGIFSERKYAFREKHEVSGDIEKHTIDFYISPNGNKGLALAVLPNPIKIIAEAWGFKSRDIKNANKNVTVGIVYDSARAKDESKAILQSTIDIPVPSSDIGDLANRLAKAGISKH